MGLLFEILKISLGALVTYISYFYYKYFTRVNPLPGPFPLPFIGNTHLVFKNFAFDVRKIRKYGDLCEFYVGSERFILLTNNEIIQPIVKPVLNGPFHCRMNDDIDGLIEIGVMNTGLFFNDNYINWLYHRKFFTRAVMTPSFIKQSVTTIQENFKEMEKFWEKFDEDAVLEFDHWMKRYFFETIFIITTSKPAYALANYYNKIAPNEISKSNVPETVLKENEAFVKSAEIYVNSLTYFFMVPRIVRNFPGIKEHTQYLKDGVDRFRNTVYDVVRSRREEISKTSIDQELNPDLLTMFLTVNTERDVTKRIADDLHDKPMSDKDIVYNFMELISAGIDTSSNSMCFLVDCLEKNPKIKQRMLKEMESVLGKDINTPLTLENLSKLEYTDAVIRESARLRAIVPTIFKKNSSPEVVGGYKWPKDTLFCLNYDGIHTHKSYWKDPEVFNPERFIENPESKNKVYLFGEGLRKCPGRHLAMMELKVTLAMLYRKYDIKLSEPMKEHMGMPRECDELKVKLRKRKNL